MLYDSLGETGASGYIVILPVDTYEAVAHVLTVMYFSSLTVDGLSKEMNV